MKQFFIAALACSAFSGHVLGQIAASFNVSHTGLAPASEATVQVGDTVLFIYGGGGPHPMMSGHGSTESPVFFPTVTVNTSIPEATTVLNEPGTYLFHCGTNPGNTLNWGTLIVQGAVEVAEEVERPWRLQPVAGGFEVVDGSAAGGYAVFNLAGQQVGQFTRVWAVDGLAAGGYVVRGMQGHAVKVWLP